MSLIDVKADPRQLAALEQSLAHIKNGLPRVLARSINKVGRGQRTQVVRFLAQKSGQKQKDIRRRNVRLLLANYRRFEARMTLRGRGVPLIDLGARQNKQGVTFRNPLTGTRETVEKAFIATMPSGHRGVFRRAKLGVDSGFMAKWGRRMGRVLSGRIRDYAKVTPEGYAWRLPIEELRGPDVVTLFEPQIPSFERETAQKLQQEILVQTQLVIAKG